MSEIKQWKESLDGSYVWIKTKIDSLTRELFEKHKENFGAEANKYDLKTYLFKSKSPGKIMSIKKQLE